LGRRSSPPARRSTRSGVPLQRLREDIGTIKSFFDANLALAHQPPPFEFYDPSAPIYTSPRNLPPAQIVNCTVADALISHGCFLDSCTVENAIVGLRSKVGKNVQIKDTMIMGCDYYEDEDDVAEVLAQGGIPLGIGENTILQNTIVDKNARIGKDCVIVNKEGIEEANREDDGIYIRSGIVTVLANATIPDGTVV